MKQNKLQFYSCSSISAWAGRENGIKYLMGDECMPYVENNGLYYYFGCGEGRAYNLLCMSSCDLGEMQ